MKTRECSENIEVALPQQDTLKQFPSFEANELLALQPDTWIQLQRLAMTGQFMPWLTHDIVQPLAAICNFTGGLQQRVSNATLLAEELSETLVRINKEALRASTIVRKLRNFAKSRSSELALINVNDTVLQAIELAKGLLESEQVVVRTDLREGLRCLFMNSNRLQQAVLNLITNAAEAVCAVPIRTRSIEIATYESEGSIEIAIRDDGPRISKEVFASLSSPFFTTKDSGLGLGLWACKSIVEERNGELLARQLTPQGLEVVVRFPIAKQIFSV